MNHEIWVVLNQIEQGIKYKISALGRPLKEWDISIYRGILTGFNEAFIISNEKRKELIKQDPKSAEIIRPILRGRDIKQYRYDFAEIFLITTFPSLKINIDLYPSVKQHLLSFGRDRLNQNGNQGSRKKTNNKWFETQDSISYWEDFSRQKIVWGEISDRTKFAIDYTGDFLTEATTFFMTGNSLFYILACLNSTLSQYIFSKIGTTTGVGTVRWKKFTIEQLQIPVVSPERQLEYEHVVNAILTSKSSSVTSDYERKIDGMLYNDFGLTTSEISFIEAQ